MSQGAAYDAGAPDASSSTTVKERNASWDPRQLGQLPALLRVEQAGELLGLSRSAAYRAAASGDLPTIRFGRRLYVPTARLLDLIGLAVPKDAR
jgi:excisionase family DNA binding protein